VSIFQRNLLPSLSAHNPEDTKSEFNSGFDADQHCSKSVVQEGLEAPGQCPNTFKAVCALTLSSVLFVDAVTI
jgi:hypothetical protein